MELLGPEPPKELRREPLLKFKVLRKPKAARGRLSLRSTSMVAYKKDLLPALSQSSPPKRLPTPRCLIPVRVFEHPFYVKKRRRYVQLIRRKTELAEPVEAEPFTITNSIQIQQPQSPRLPPISEHRLPKPELQVQRQSIQDLLGPTAVSLSERRQAKVAGVFKYFSPGHC